MQHSAMTNKEKRRETFAIFYAPNVDSVIGTIEELIDDEHPLFNGNCRYTEFIQEFFRQEGKM